MLDKMLGKISKHFIVFTVLVLAALLMTACGKKANLYLPKNDLQESNLQENQAKQEIAIDEEQKDDQKKNSQSN